MMSTQGLTKAEISQLYASGASGLSTSTINEILEHFDDMDTNHDGRLTQEEISAYSVNSARQEKVDEYAHKAATNMSVFYGSESSDTTSSYDTDVLIAGGFDYYKSGILTGELIEKVLDGTKPEDIGVQYLSTEDLEIYVNLDVAEAIGIEIPENVISNASIIIKDGSVL